MRTYAQTWETQNSGVMFTLRSVCFVDTLTGWVIGDSSIILQTSNGGKNWSYQTPPETYRRFTHIQFVSKSIGYIVGTNGLILSTKDGGQNWDVSPSNTDVDLWDLSFINENEGWITGSKTYTDHSIGLIIHTKDGGLTYEKQVEIISSSQFGAKLFSAIKFQNNKVGWALAGDNVDNFSSTSVYKTEDGGLRWNSVGIINGTPSNKLAIANGDTLWCAGYSTINLAVSVDGGINWIMPSNKLSKAIAVCPKSGLVGWISYYDFLANDKRVLYTVDLGTTWKEELKLEQTVLAMSYADEYLWLVGTNGLIMKRFPTPTSIEYNDKATPSSFHLFQNYPNPFNNSTTIPFQLSRMSDVNLSIFNYLGQLIRSFTFSSLASGTHLIQWDGKNNIGKHTASGVYICKMNVKNESERNTNRFIKIIFLK